VQKVEKQWSFPRVILLTAHVLSNWEFYVRERYFFRVGKLGAILELLGSPIDECTQKRKVLI